MSVPSHRDEEKHGDAHAANVGGHAEQAAEEFAEENSKQVATSEEGSSVKGHRRGRVWHVVVFHPPQTATFEAGRV